MSKATFVRFERLAEDLATARHNWREHKLALALSAQSPGKDAASVAGLYAQPLDHSMLRAGNVVSLIIESVVVRATETTIGPFSCAAIVNATTGAPIAFSDLGKAITLEDGGSTEFRFPADVLTLTA